MGRFIVYAFYIIQRFSLLWALLYVLAYTGYFFYLLKFSCTACPYWRKEGCPLGFNKLSHQLFGGFDEEEDEELVERVKSLSGVNSVLIKVLWFALDLLPAFLGVLLWLKVHSPSAKLHYLYIFVGYCAVVIVKPLLHSFFLCSTCERRSGCLTR